MLTLAGLFFTPSQSKAGFFYDRPFPDIDWLVLETDHFIIYYYEDVEWTAKMVAKYAEIAYPRVTGLFDYPLKEKIHIVVRDQEENANGWAAYNFDQITAWATPLYYVLRGRQEWIPDMFTHEFAHIVSLKANDWKSEAAVVAIGSGLVEDGVNNIDYGAELVIGRSAPFFWIEGIAEYGTHLSGFNWWTTARDMVQRMSMLEDNYLEYEEMFEVYSRSAGMDRERGYQQGYTMGLYTMEKFGKEKYAQLALNASKKGHMQWEKNIEEVLGVDGQTLFDGYIKWMKDRYNRQVAPIKTNEHIGFPMMADGQGRFVEELERLPDKRWKVKIHGQKCFIKEYEEPEAQRKLQAILFGADAAKAEEFAAMSAKEKIEVMDAFFDKEENKDKKEEANKINEELKEKYPIVKSKVEYWHKQKRKQFHESEGQYTFYPKLSPDGKYTAISAGRRSGGIVISPVSLEEDPAFSGYCMTTERMEEIADETKTIKGAGGGGYYDFTPDSKKVIFASTGCPNSSLPCISLDGYYRYDLYEFDIENEDIERMTRRLRAVNPRYSPDGKKIAFVRIEDGQNWLGTFSAEAREVSPDGTCVIGDHDQEDCIQWLIKKKDGTQLGVPSWSPDGSQIVIDIYRNHQQDIWMINADGSGLKPLTWDKAEDRDGQFSPDGKSVFYVSDRSGIYNVYQLSLETQEVRQITNVLGGIFTPFVTADGDLLYSYFRSYGAKVYAHKKENFYNKVIEAGYEVTDQEVQENLAYQESLPEIIEHSTSYNAFDPDNWAPVIGIPMFAYRDRGAEIGIQGILLDALGKHSLFAMASLGATSIFYAGYENNFWYPSFYFSYAKVNAAYEFSQGITPFEISEPRFETPLTYKIRQMYDLARAGMDYELSDEFTFNLEYFYMHATSRRPSGSKQDALLTRNSYSARLEYDNLARWIAETDINPRGGRTISLSYDFNRTGLPQKNFAEVEWLGRANPPGDDSDDYHSHTVEFGYTEYIPVSWWNKNGMHTFELHVRAGMTNRNVYMWDEFAAGALHPLGYVPAQQTTNEFAGFEDYSLRGENMMVFGMTYRFPLVRHIDKKIGPFYFVSVWAELFGTMGNLWGYTGEYMRDKYGNIARDPEAYWDPAIKPGSARPEIPFKDIASKNGNYLLYDIGFTLKLKAFIFGTTDWNSYFRVAYGLNDIIGSNEVNDDWAFVDAYPADALYAESEPKSLHISIGIGTSFQ
jgi:Tol biopolymer transport system component